MDIQAEQDIGVLIHTLEKMKTIFESCQVNSSEQDKIKALPKMLTISYTETEETWIQVRKIHKWVHTHLDFSMLR